MKNLHLDQIRARCDWLQAIVSNNQLLSNKQLKAITSMKSFAELDVENYFTKVSYNTLKRHSKISTPPNNGAFKDYWDLLIHLREEACRSVLEANETVSNQTISNETLVKESLLHAHICSTAYLEIFNFLEQLDLNNTLLTEHTRFGINKFLAQARVKYSLIISAGRPVVNSELTVIRGGRSK